MKFFIIFIILYVLYLNNTTFAGSAVVLNKCKISVLLSGDYNDLGYNYMMNEARVKAESELKLEYSIYFKHLEESLDEAELAIQDSINQGSNLIFVSSVVHFSLGVKYATLYKDKPIYWVIRGSRIPVDLPKVVILNFNSFELHYILGYFSGLMSKTNVVGFVSPGVGINTLSTDNSFFLGARYANPNITFLDIHTGSWYSPEVAYKAAQKLIENGADFIGMSQDDMSVQKALIDIGLLGIGATGFPASLQYGSEAGYGYVTNWTQLFIKYATHVVEDSWPLGDSYFTSLSRQDSIFMDDFSFRVPVEIQDLVNNEKTRLMNISYAPYKSDPYLAQLGIPFVDGLLNDTLFRANTKLLNGDGISKVIDFGTFTIPIKFVDYPNSLKNGVTVVSGICILVCVGCMIAVIVLKDARMIKSSSPAFCLLILFGCITVFVGCIMFARSPTNASCSSRVWLLSLGYTIFLGNLLVKNWRIWLLFDNPKLKKRAITNWKLYPWVSGILAIDLLILGVWQGLGNIYSESRVGIDSLTKYEYSNVCTSNQQGSIALYILIVFHGLVLLVACFISFKIKSVDIIEFNESKPITTTVYIVTFCLFIVIPIMVSSPSVVTQTTIICICAIVTTIVSIILLFGSKFYLMATRGLEMNQTFATSTKSSSFNNSQKKSSRSSKSSNGKENANGVGNNNYIHGLGDDDSDELSQEKGKPNNNEEKSFVVSGAASVLAVFTSDEENDDDIESADDNDDNDDQSNNNNNSIVKEKRLSSKNFGEIEVEKIDV